MTGLSISDVAALPTARRLFGADDTPLTGVTIDTREDRIDGKLYIALKGDRSDGHEFIEQAAVKGVRCVLIEPRGVEKVRVLHAAGKCPAAVVVADTLAGMGELARRHRSRLNAKIVAVTGSNGKTSTKDFIASILSTTFRTYCAPRSFNNAIGVPWTILQMTPDTQVGVLEIGMNHPGEIAALCKIANPDVVGITTIAPAHVGFFRSLRQVALAKSEILTASRSGIPAFLPADSPFLPVLLKRAVHKNVATFGISSKAQWRLRDVRAGVKNLSFGVQTDSGLSKFHCPNFGEHQLTNVVLAIGISSQFAIPLKKIRAAVSHLRLPAGRGETIRINGHVVINDSYNANPSSMAASLKRISVLGKLLGKQKSTGRLDVILVLGDMLELGSQSKQYHKNLGAQVKTLKPWKIIFVGEQGEHVRKGYIAAGGRAKDILCFRSTDPVADMLKQWMGERERLLILLKASNQIRLGIISSTICQKMSV